MNIFKSEFYLSHLFRLLKIKGDNPLNAKLEFILKTAVYASILFIVASFLLGWIYQWTGFQAIKIHSGYLRSAGWPSMRELAGGGLDSGLRYFYFFVILGVSIVLLGEIRNKALRIFSIIVGLPISCGLLVSFHGGFEYFARGAVTASLLGLIFVGYTCNSKFIIRVGAILISVMYIGSFFQNISAWLDVLQKLLDGVSREVVREFVGWAILPSLLNTILNIYLSLLIPLYIWKVINKDNAAT